MCGAISSDPNVANASGPYIWSRYVDKATAQLPVDASYSEIVDLVLEMTPETLSLYVSGTVKAIRELGMSDEQLVLMAGSTIDYLANTLGKTVGGEFVNAGTGDVDHFMVTYSTVDAAMAPVSMSSIDKASGEVDAFIKSVNARAGFEMISDKWITGTAAVMYDISKDVSDEFTIIEVLVVVFIILLLFVVMRSYIIPFRSVFTILMSICWTLTMTHIVFSVVLGVDVTWLIPLILLVICLGLGMDYDILLTTRIRENVIKGMTTDEAIHHAVTHTGSVITICGLIMGGAFGTLMLSSMVMMQQFGFALCFAILCDALIVRSYIVPAIMHLFGDWNWKGPKFMQKRSA